MTYEEALAAWEAAKQATSEAREAVESAKQKHREAESHLQRMWDAERQAWLAVRDAEWQEYRAKTTGELLDIQRVHITEDIERDAL